MKKRNHLTKMKVIGISSILAIVFMLGALALFIQNDLILPEKPIAEKIVREKYTSAFFDVEVTRMPLHVETFNITDEENATIGASIDSDKLEFGILPLGAKATKELNLKNEDSVIVKMSLVPYGTTTIVLEEDEFYLKPLESKKVLLHFVGPEEEINETGELRIQSYKPKSFISKLVFPLV